MRSSLEGGKIRNSLDGKMRQSLDSSERDSMQYSKLFYIPSKPLDGDLARPNRPSSTPLPVRPQRPNRPPVNPQPSPTPTSVKRSSITSITGTFASISSASTATSASTSAAAVHAVNTAYSQLTKASKASSIHSPSSYSMHSRSRSRSASSPLPNDPSATPSLSRPLVLHPDFRGEGDVVLVCNDDGELVGFRANSSMLRMASPTLAALLKDKKGSSAVPHFVKVTDRSEDMHAFLRLLRFGAPAGSDRPSTPVPNGVANRSSSGSTHSGESSPTDSTSPDTPDDSPAISPVPTLSPTTPRAVPPSASTCVPPDFFPTISQYDGINRLALKYNGWYPRAVLDFHVELRAPEIVNRVGRAGTKDDVFALVRLAHNLHSSFLWAEICERLRTSWWHDILNPWKFTDADIDILGDSIFSLLSILASVSSRPKLYSHLDELCVLYSEEGDVSVAATERRSMQQCCNCFK